MRTDADDNMNELEVDESFTAAYETSHEQIKIPDGGIRAWMVCLTASLTVGTIFCIINSFGVMYNAFQTEYQNASDLNINLKTSSVWSLSTGMAFGLSPVASILIDRFGIREMAFLGGALSFSGMLLTSFVSSYRLVYLTYGVMFGCGISFMNTGSVVILGHYFKHRLGRASGLVMAGSGCFLIGAPYFHKLVIQHLGLRHDFHILSGMLSLFMVYALVWKPTFNSKLKDTAVDCNKTNNADSSRFEKMKEMLDKIVRFDNFRNKNYIVWMSAMVISNFGYYVPFVHLVKYVETKNTNFDGPGLLTIMSVASVFSRIVVGFIADHPAISRLFVLQISFVIMSVCTTVFPLINNYTGLAVLIFLLGLCDGCKITLFGPIALDLVGPHGLAQAVGLSMGLGSIPSMSGPSIAGFLVDYLGTYSITFYLAGLPPILAALIMFNIKNISHQTKNEKLLSEESPV